MTQNMFQIGNQNPEEVSFILGYLEHFPPTGMCTYLIECYQSSELLKDQEVFHIEQHYPIEWFILTSAGYEDILFATLHHEYSQQYSKADPTTPYGQLRRWWCYNLAVAMSQGMF